MNKEITNKIVNHVINTKTVFILILYLIVGAVFTSFQYSDNNYIYMFTQVLTNKIYITLFVFPVLFVIFAKLYDSITNNSFILLRINTKKSLFKIYIESGIKIIICFTVILLLIIGIATNITPHKNNFFVSDFKYDIYDIIVCIVSLIKISVFMFVYYLLTICLFKITKKEHVTLILLFLTLIVIFLNSRFYLNGPLFFLNIDIHFYNLYGFNKIIDSLFYTTIFDFLIITILYYTANKLTLKEKKYDI